MNNFPNGLKSNLELFADNTSLFSTVHDIITSTFNLNNDLKKICKMIFNPDPSIQAQDLLFSQIKQVTNDNHY